MQFVAWLHTKGLTSGTVKGYLAAIRHSRRPEDWGDAPVGVCVAGDEANGAETDENAAPRYPGDNQGIETGVATAP